VQLLLTIALLCVLLILLCNVVLYAWRTAVVRRQAVCDRPERLGVLSAAWAFGQECAACAAVALLVVLGWLTPRCGHGGGDRGPLIVLHGWGMNRGPLWLLRRRLLRDGWSPVCCVAHPAFGIEVERAAQQLQDAAAHIASGASARPLTLIGYGRGGLVLRYHLRRYPASIIRRIVTLGTPHAGTEVARLVGTAAELAPESRLLGKLNAADHLPQQFDVIAIHSTFDATILPPQNAQYPGAFNVQLNNVGHYALLFSSKVYRLLAENLAASLR
jgi:triacylglycerol lipase